jgi:tetratricopeptide (TPR) repeat protein
LDCYNQSIALCRELGDLIGEAEAHSRIGLLWLTAGDLDRALDCQREALESSKELGAMRQQATALGNIALVHHRREEYDDGNRADNR